MTDQEKNRREKLRAMTVGVKTNACNMLNSIWWFFLLRGIFAITLGIFAIFWPSKSLSVLVLAVGLFCFADGMTGLIAALRQPELRENLAHALIVLGIGAVLVFWPGATMRILLVLFGAAALIAGIGQILTARRLSMDDPERSQIMTIGITAAVVGLVLAFWPGSGVAVISWVIGISAILIGAFLIYLGTRFNRLTTRLDMQGKGNGR